MPNPVAHYDLFVRRTELVATPSGGMEGDGTHGPSSYAPKVKANREKFGDGQWIRVASRRGELTGKALFTDRMRPGEIFIPFVKLTESAANFLTNSAYDPDSKIPEYKVCAVRVEALV